MEYLGGGSALDLVSILNKSHAHRHIHAFTVLFTGVNNSMK